MNIFYAISKHKYGYYLLTFTLFLLMFQPVKSVLSQGTVDAVDDYPASLLNNQAYAFPAPGVLGNDTQGVTVISADMTTTEGNVVTVNTDGSWSVTSANGFLGAASFTYTIDNGTGAQDTATVYLTYEAPPPAPVDAVDDYPANLLNNQAYAFPAPGVLGNDTAGVSVISSDTSTTSGGAVTVNSDGSWSVTSAAGFVGATSFTYTIGNGTGAQDTATVYLTYEAPPPAPVDAVDDYPAKLFNSQDHFFDAPGLLANDSPGATIVGSNINTLFDGTGYVNSDGAWFVPFASDFVGTLSFSYTIANSTGAQDTATVYLTYEAQPNIVTVPDFFTVYEGTPLLNANVLDNDKGVGLTVEAFGSPPDLSLDADGTLHYTPPLGSKGSNSFPYQVHDTFGNQAQGYVTITVEATPTGLGCGFELPQSECDALLNLYNSTTGVSWTKNSGWNTTSSPCTWYGISCGSGHVIKIQLPANNLSGSIPVLPDALIELDLSSNQLSGSIPALPATLGNLFLNNNQLSGNIPALPSGLSSLFLDNNQLSGSIPALPATAFTVQLSNNQLSGSIPALPDGLQGLLVSNNHLTGNIPVLPAQMLVLSVHTNQLTGIIPMLPAALRELAVSKNQLTGTIPALPPSLYLLWVDGNQLSGELPASLANTAIDQSSRLRLCSGNDLFSTNPAVNTFVETWNSGWAAHGNRCIALNQPPVANAGPDQTVKDTDNNGSESVTLSGSLSSDSDGAITSYLWSENGTELTTGVTPTVNLAVGMHVITLTVTDNRGGTAIDTVTIDVVLPPNVLPTANAGTDQTVKDTDNNGSENVTLNGSLSSDSDGAITSYLWSENGIKLTTGIRPIVNLTVGVHVITLTVTDNRGGTATDTVTIDVVLPPNVPPTANAGPDQTVMTFSFNGSAGVSLNGGLSSDPDGTVVSYSWSEGGSPLATGATPLVYLNVGTHTITLTVTDNRGGTATDTVTIDVVPPPNARPMANAGPDQTVMDYNNNGYKFVSLNGGLSSDPDGTVVSYSWSEGGSPLATGATPIVFLTVGTHTITLTVTDNRGGTATDTVTIIVYRDRGNSIPVATNDSYSTNRNTPLNVPSRGVLSNDTDADGDNLISVLVSGTANGSVALLGTGGFNYTPNANFTGNDSFTYKANDGKADSNIVTVTITVLAPPPANVAPQLTIYLSEVPVLRGYGTFNVGDYSDSNGDNVSLTASVGSVVKTGNSAGSWIWSYTVPFSTTRGTVITVRITATDARGATSSKTFKVRVL